MQKNQKHFPCYCPDKLVRLIVGGLSSAIIRIALDLGAFEKIDNRRISISELKTLLGIPLSSCRVLVQYLCILGLLEYQNGMIRNPPIIKKYLLKNPTSTKWIKHLLRINKWSYRLKEKILTPPIPQWYSIRDGKQAIQEEFYKGWFHQRRIQWGEELAKEYDFTRHKILLDIGGASGGWCIGILKLFPHLKCIVFDIPSVCQIAKQYIEKSGLSNKIKVMPGSIFRNNLPKGADIILLANFLHDWIPEENRKILSKIYHILPKKGVVLVSEFFFKNDFRGSAWAAVQALSVLGPELKSGWQPNYQEMGNLLNSCGFRAIQRKLNLLIAKK